MGSFLPNSGIFSASRPPHGLSSWILGFHDIGHAYSLGATPMPSRSNSAALDGLRSFGWLFLSRGSLCLGGFVLTSFMAAEQNPHSRGQVPQLKPAEFS